MFRWLRAHTCLPLSFRTWNLSKASQAHMDCTPLSWALAHVRVWGAAERGWHTRSHAGLAGKCALCAAFLLSGVTSHFSSCTCICTYGSGEPQSSIHWHVQGGDKFVKVTDSAAAHGFRVLTSTLLSLRVASAGAACVGTVWPPSSSNVWGATPVWSTPQAAHCSRWAWPQPQ